MKAIGIAEMKFLLIRFTIEKYNLRNMVSFLCNLSGVSRSGYNNYFSLKSQERRNEREKQDKLFKKNILKAFNFKKRKKGARQIKMTLMGQFNLNYNLKRISRIMKKYNIFCPIRKTNPYRRMAKATKEHTALPNSLNRQFKQSIPGKSIVNRYHIFILWEGKESLFIFD